MKELYSLKPLKRRRLILVLGLFFSMILITELIENKNLQEIDSNFSSLYEDRLVPAAQMYELSELLHEKQLIFELLNEQNFQLSKENQQKIRNENRSINGILSDYETTYLVKEEKQYLASLKENLLNYQEVEAEILYHINNQNFSAAQLLINSEARESFDLVSENLHSLAQIQPEIGKEIFSHYQSSFGNSSTLYYIKIALTIFLGIFVLRLLGLSNLVTHPKQKFDLN